MALVALAALVLAVSAMHAARNEAARIECALAALTSTSTDGGTCGTDGGR
jgi:hypothetical protein